MPTLIRWLAAACLPLSLTACTKPSRDADPGSSTGPSAVASVGPRMTPIPRAATTPTTGPHKYLVNDLWFALPEAYGTHSLRKGFYPYPPPADWKPRTDPLDGRTVAPELCRDVIRYVGVPGVPGDFVAPATPGVGAFAALGPTTGPARPFVSVNLVELPAPLGDRMLDQRQPTPAECAHIQVDGRELASVVERPVPGFGVRARYIVRTYPIAGKTWIERTLQYRTATYVVLFRLDAYANPEAAFLAFAGKTRDGLTSALQG